MNHRKQQYIDQATSSKTQVKATPKVALYHRVSSKKQADEQTIKRQQAVTKELYQRKLGASRGKKLIGSFEDEAYNFENWEPHRAFWSDIIPLIESGEVNTIVAANPDRIFRGASSALKGQISDLFYKHKVRLLTTNSDFTYDRSNTSGMIVDSLTQTLGAKEKMESVSRMHSGRRRRLEEDAEFRIPVCPYGLRMEAKKGKGRTSYVYTICEEEAVVVRDVFALYSGKKTELLPAQSKPIGATRIAELLNTADISRQNWIESLSEGMQKRC